MEMFPCVLRAATRVSVVVRSAAGIDRRGLHVDQHRSARRSRWNGWRRGRRRSASSDGFRAAAAARSRTGAVIGGDRDQRRDRRRLGARQGHPRPLHARGRARAIPAGASRSTSATPPPSIARRSRRSGSRRCTAARSRASPTPSSGSAIGEGESEAGRRRSRRRLDVLDVDGSRRASKVTPTASKRISA